MKQKKYPKKLMEKKQTDRATTFKITTVWTKAARDIQRLYVLPEQVYCVEGDLVGVGGGCTTNLLVITS